MNTITVAARDILALVFGRHDSQKLNTNWDYHEPLSGPVMRRYVNGRSEIRPMTIEEETEYVRSRCGW